MFYQRGNTFEMPSYDQSYPGSSQHEHNMNFNQNQNYQQQNNQYDNQHFDQQYEAMNNHSSYDNSYDQYSNTPYDNYEQNHNSYNNHSYDRYNSYENVSTPPQSQNYHNVNTYRNHSNQQQNHSFSMNNSCPDFSPPPSFDPPMPKILPPVSTGTPKMIGKPQPDVSNVNATNPGTKMGESDCITISEFAEIIHNTPVNIDCFDAIVDVLEKSMETTSPAHTTLMLRNVPQEYTQSEFFNELETLGVSQWIDFLYMPPNHRQQAPDSKRKVSQLGNAGLTFINFINTDCMHDFIAIFQGGLCLRKYPVKSMNDEDLISLIPSTTQGWRANVLKVVRNCIMKRKKIHPEELPVLFCRESGERIPFPIPRSAYADKNFDSNRSADKSNLVKPTTSRNTSNLDHTPISLSNEFDNDEQEIHSTSNASKQSSGKKSSNPSNLSYESEKIMVKHDPLNALAPGINNDAIAPSFESDYAAKRRLMMEEQTLYEQTMVEQYEDQFPHQFSVEGGIDSAMHQEHAYYDENLGNSNYNDESYGYGNNFGNNNYGNGNSYQNYGNQYQNKTFTNKSYQRSNTNNSFPKNANKKQQFDWNSLPDEHPLKIFKTGRCQKASDFLEKHSVEKHEENVSKHLSNIESMRRNMRKCCKNERNSMSRADLVNEKLKRVKNFNKSTSLSFSGKRDSVSTLNEVTASKDSKQNVDCKKAVTEFKNAIQRSLSKENLETVPESVKEFVNIDVEHLSSKNWEEKILERLSSKHSSTNSDCSGNKSNCGSDDSFNSKLFNGNTEVVKKTEGEKLLWSNAEACMKQMLIRMSSENETDDCGAVAASRARLFGA